MQNIEVAAMRAEYSALVKIAEGLIEMIRRQETCNIVTFARMAEQARAAARKIASAIERIILEAAVSNDRPPSCKDSSVITFFRNVVGKICSLFGV
jgi:hypothetical protein